MPPTKLERQAEQTKHVTTSNNAVGSGPDDVTHIDDLIKNLQDRLGGGAQNEFFEVGSRLDGKQHKAQLETTFALLKALQDESAQRKQQHVDPEQTNRSTNVAQQTVNKNMMATIKIIVEQEMSAKLRDLALRNERLEAGLQKSESQCKALAQAVETQRKLLLRKGYKVPLAQTMPGNDPPSVDIATLGRKVDALARDIEHLMARDRASLSSNVPTRESRPYAMTSQTVNPVYGRGRGTFLSDMRETINMDDLRKLQGRLHTPKPYSTQVQPTSTDIEGW